MEMTPLTWTSEKPTKPGWYWCRHNSHVEPEILKVEVSGDTLVIYRDEEMLEMPPGECSGPVVSPT